MNTDQAKALAKQHGPTVAIAAVIAVVVAKLVTPSTPSPASTPPPPPAPVKTSGNRISARPLKAEAPPVATSQLLLCDGASFVGDDSSGTVTHAIDGCTVVFTGSYAVARKCTVTGVKVRGISEKMFSVEAVVSPGTFSYKCQP